MSQTESPHRWIIISLCALTAVCVIAIPSMSLSVLFDAIASDLDISLVQIGLIWGTSSFTGMVVGLLGGVLGDRFGARLVVTISCIGVGLLGASRGFATGFYTFIGYSFLMGLFAPLIGVILHNVAGRWFSSDQLGLANGIISSGFAAGFLLGALLASSTFAPWLGGWRPVFFLYGGVALLIAVGWWVLHPAEVVDPSQTDSGPSIWEGLPKVLRIRTVWLLGIGKFGVWGCMRGFTGYLPLYLRGEGWDPNTADAALSAFFVVSLLGAIPIPLLSDRLGIRRPFLIVAALLMGCGTLFLGFTTTGFVFLAVMLAGILFDAYMGLSITLVSEVKAVSGSLIGTAVGAIFFISDIGGTISPPIGNALATISPEFPFYFWSGLAFAASIALYLVQEKRRTAISLQVGA